MRADLFSGLFWLLFAIFFSMESYRLGLGQPGMPGPGFFSFGASVLLGVSSLCIVAIAWRKVRQRGIPAKPSEVLHWWNIAMVVAGMVAYALLISRVGFVLCTFSLIVLFVRVVARRRWFLSLIIALAVSLGSHLLFNVLLNTQMPRGIFGFLGL